MRTKGVTLRIIYTLNDFGKSPAVRVSGRIRIHLIRFAPEGPVNIRQKKIGVIQAADSKPVDKVAEFNVTLYPNATLITFPLQVSATREDLVKGFISPKNPGQFIRFLSWDVLHIPTMQMVGSFIPMYPHSSKSEARAANVFSTSTSRKASCKWICS
jgi:hypothetical protein